jgi:LmbE family N-acetylglucosaminyl deacetylase
MPTDAALFLFAHQDDEFGVFQRIADCRAQGLRVACAYLTDGASGGVSAGTRNAESRAVLTRLGVARDDIAFAGAQLDIGDARLPQHLAEAEAWLGGWLGRFPAIDALYVPAWEGGHHDHDALHALVVRLAERHGLLARTFQFALYHGWRCPGPWFRVLSPLPHNGVALCWRIPLRARWQFLRLCLSYPSQRGSWTGLFPFVLLHYLLRGQQTLQPVAPARLAERPHAGRLYYEKRGFYRWDQMAHALGAWQQAAQQQ